jgi:hypothetical protein
MGNANKKRLITKKSLTSLFVSRSYREAPLTAIVTIKKKSFVL